LINGKTYYQILGVLEDAEDVVIRAAYKVLAQKYHPDKWTGDPKEANERMSEINRANEVLCDLAKRRAYDDEQGKGEYEEVSSFEDDVAESFDRDWKDAQSYFPDLARISADLRSVSRELERTYKLLLLERKLFNKRVELADQLERSFLERYFGTDPKVLQFAKYCITRNAGAAAKEVNRAVNLLGSDVDSGLIIDRVLKDFFPGCERAEVRLAHGLLSGEWAGTHAGLLEQSERFLEKLGASLGKTGLLSNSYNVTLGQRKYYDVNEPSLINLARVIAEDVISGKFSTGK